MMFNTVDNERNAEAVMFEPRDPGNDQDAGDCAQRHQKPHHPFIGNHLL